MSGRDSASESAAVGSQRATRSWLSDSHRSVRRPTRRLGVETLEDRRLLAAVTGRHVFYNESAYDEDTPGVDVADSFAIATDKSAYLPGDGMIALSSVTAYARGINGIMVDLAGPHGTLSLDDFDFKMSGQGAAVNNTPATWVAAPLPSGFTVLADTPAVGTDRVELTWETGAIENRYLEVTVSGDDAAGGNNTNTGLPATDVFYYGNRIGDTFTASLPASFITTGADEVEVRESMPAFDLPITNNLDFDKNGALTAADQIAVRQNVGFQLRVNLYSGAYLIHADGSRTFYPATDGTDRARGTAFRSAAAAAVAGETVLLGPGIYNIDATIAAVELPAGVKVKGAGIDVTTIESGIHSGYFGDRCLLDVADNVTLEDFTFYATASNGLYQFPVGRLRLGTFSNVTMRRVKIDAPNGSDAFYTWTAPGSSLFLFDCDFRSAYDTIAFLASNPGDFLYAKDCYFESMGGNWSGGPNGIANNLVNKAGSFYLINCSIKTRNDAGGNTQTLGVWNYQNNAVTTLINCNFDVSAADGEVFDLYRPGGGSGGFVISGGHGSGPNGEITTSGGNVTYLQGEGSTTGYVPPARAYPAPNGSLLPISNLYDYDKNGVVNANDQLVARANIGFQFRIDVASPTAAVPARLAFSGDPIGSAVSFASSLAGVRSETAPDTSAPALRPLATREPASAVARRFWQQLGEASDARASIVLGSLDRDVETPDFDEWLTTWHA